MLKAYVCNFKDEEWCLLVHGEDANKAKARFFRVEPAKSGYNSFTDIRVKRLPGQDDKPFTYDNAKAAGFEYEDVDGAHMRSNDFVNDCDCSVCKGKQ